MTAQQPVPPDESDFTLSRSTVFPLVGNRSTWSHEYLLPIFATVCAALALIVVFNPTVTGKDEITEAWQVYSILGLYIAFMVNYYINQMCGRAKRLWVMALVALTTFLLLGSPLWQSLFTFFYNVIPGTAWEKSSDPAVQLAGYFFGTGLCEESFKALPLLALALLGAGLAWLGRHSHGRLGRLAAAIRRHVCVCEPLDGIALGVASGSGFFLAETLGQYVPGIMTTAKYAGSEAFAGLVVLLARGLPDLVEHSAWSGLFGYFIGLSVLRPRMAIVLLPLGWFSAAALHGAWDASSEVTQSGAITIGCWLFLALLSYALLGGALFKARDISPARAAAAAKAQRTEGATVHPAPALAPAGAWLSDEADSG
jgi:RsiW-degrading membrane proteinase PrsW (M82 family)